jgi:hypothetical protein
VAYPNCEVPLIFHMPPKGCWVVRAYKHACTLTHVCVYIHTYIHTHTHTQHTHTSQDIAADIGTRLRTESSGFRTPTEQLVSLFSIPSRSALGPAQPPIRWVPDSFRGVSRSRREADYSPTTSAGVQDGRTYTFTSLMHLHGTDSDNFTPHTGRVLFIPLRINKAADSP